MKTLTPSVNTPTDSQIGKLHERLLSAARKSGVSSKHFQAALAHPGTELEDKLLDVIVQFAEKVNHFVTPVSAINTGLVPDGWKIVSDDLEGNISLDNLDYSISPPERCVETAKGTILSRHADTAYGSLGLAAILLKKQEEGKEIFPVESRGVYFFVMPRTILLKSYKEEFISFFRWEDESKKWIHDYTELSVSFGHGLFKYICPRKLRLVV
ncbi:MAG: hypothetical protein Q8O93_05565 [bacterium]|nr:hypothetical protein [bacterium]